MVPNGQGQEASLLSDSGWSWSISLSALLHDGPYSPFVALSSPSAHLRESVLTPPTYNPPLAGLSAFTGSVNSAAAHLLKESHPSDSAGLPCVWESGIVFCQEKAELETFLIFPTYDMDRAP